MIVAGIEGCRKFLVECVARGSKASMVREKTRHLLLELIWKDEHRGHNMTKVDFSKLLVKALKRLYGPLGTADFPQNLNVRYFDRTANLCILRCNREQKIQVLFSRL